MVERAVSPKYFCVNELLVSRGANLMGTLYSALQYQGLYVLAHVSRDLSQPCVYVYCVVQLAESHFSAGFQNTLPVANHRARDVCDVVDHNIPFR